MQQVSRPKQIGKYNIIGSLGRGAMGVVYKGQDPEIGRIVAIKTLRKLNELKGAKRTQALERFRSEARSAGNLRHPNIITVFEANVEDETPYIVMDHVQGESFDRLLARLGRLSPTTTLYFMSQVALALDYAHKQGIVHRDIKPANLVINEEGQVFILDFGIAKISDSFAGESNQPRGPIMGTPGYMSPEQILNQALDNRSDLFSFAVVIYECLMGQRPFNGQSYQEITEQILKAEPPMLVGIANLNGSVIAVINQALAKQKHQRFNSAVDLIEALKDAFLIKELVKPRPAELYADISDQSWQSLSSGSVNAKAETEDIQNQDTYVPPVHAVAVLKRSPSAQKRRSLTINDQKESGDNKKINYFLTTVLALALILTVSLFYILLQFQNRVVISSAEQMHANQDDQQDSIINLMQVEKNVTELEYDDLIQLTKSAETQEPLLLSALREAERRKIADLVSACNVAMRHDSTNLRLEAAKILGRTRQSESLDLLLPALDDYDPRVRIAVAEALAAVGSRRAISYLNNALVIEDVPSVIEAIRNAIKTIQGFEESVTTP